MDEPERGSDGPEAPSTASRLLAAFGHFWWEFLIGDTPELFIGVVMVIGLAALLCLDRGLRTAGALMLPAAVAALLVGSVWKSARGRT